jgi:octaprenyl-diphosphate synthase
MQLTVAKNTATTEDEYLAVIRGKTAALFAAACEVGPIIAGKGKDEQAACRSYGANLGIAFQLVDDALDYGGKSSKLGKNLGDDFREGKITLPVVLSFRRGSDTERAFWKRALENGETGEAESGGFSRTGLGETDEILALERERDRGGLDVGGFLVAE